MSPAVRVALIGFTRFERQHLEAGLQPAGGQDPAYVLVDPAAGWVVAIVNADDEASVAQVVQRGRLSCTVMLGTTVRPGAAAQLPRPLSLAPLLQALDRAVHTGPALSAATQRVHDDLARLVPRSAAAAPGLASMTVIQSLGPASAAIPQASRAELDQVLVVDEDSTVLRFMATHLQRLGYEVQLARNATQALDKATRHRFDFVFLATGMEGADGFHICRTLKRRSHPQGQTPPKVVLLLREDLAANRLRAEMAGADACLAKPLRAEHLPAVLNTRPAPSDAEAETTLTGSTAWM